MLKIKKLKILRKQLRKKSFRKKKSVNLPFKQLFKQTVTFCECVTSMTLAPLRFLN